MRDLASGETERTDLYDIHRQGRTRGKAGLDKNTLIPHLHKRLLKALKPSLNKKLISFS